MKSKCEIVIFSGLFADARDRTKNNVSDFQVGSPFVVCF